MWYVESIGQPLGSISERIPSMHSVGNSRARAPVSIPSSPMYLTVSFCRGEVFVAARCHKVSALESGPFFSKQYRTAE